MLGLDPWISLVVVVMVTLLARRMTSGAGVRVAQTVRASLDSRAAPFVVGALTASATLFVWASLRRSAVIHDESAYLLQAQLFARLRWTSPAPPLPDFFQQLYVNLAPAISSKYPPGTSLLLAPGMLIGLPGLPVILTNAVTGALVFAVARRAIGGTAAALAWALWITSYPVLYYHAMYVSEVPSSLAWIAAWWGLLRWRDNGRPSGLIVSAAAVALCAITRPLTAVALVLSLACVLLALFARGAAPTMRQRARVVAPFVLAGVLAVAFLTMWNWRSTGDPRLSPLTLYTRTWVPFDKLGFGATLAQQPSPRLPYDQRVTSYGFYQEHRIHTVPKLPLITLVRARTVAHDMWYDWRGGLAVLAVLGLVGAPVIVWIGLGALVVQLLCYLLYAHSWSWSLYYIEAQPLLAAITALGIARLCTWRASRSSGERAEALAAAALLLVMLVPAAITARQVRAQIAADHEYYDSFSRMLPRVAGGAIVFVRYTATHNDGLSLVRNAPVAAQAPVWTVYDRGEENTRLMAAAPGRAAFLFDEATWTLSPLSKAVDRAR